MINLAQLILKAVKRHTGKSPLVIEDTERKCSDGTVSHDVTFKLEGISKWIFQVNAMLREKDEKEKLYIVMKGDHVWEATDRFNDDRYDKYFPSPICYEDEFELPHPEPYIEIYKLSKYSDFPKYGGNPPMQCVKFLEDINTIVNSPIGAYIKFYYDFYQRPCNVAMWLLDKWYTNVIKFPIRNFKKNSLLKFWLSTKKFLHTVLFGKFIDGIYIEDMKETLGNVTHISPRYTYTVWFKKGISQRTLCRLIGLIDPLHPFSNVGYEMRDGENNEANIVSPVKMEFCNFHNEISNAKLKCYWYGKKTFTWEKFFTKLKLNLKYAVKYPVYWFRYKFEAIE